MYGCEYGAEAGHGGHGGGPGQGLEGPLVEVALAAIAFPTAHR